MSVTAEVEQFILEDLALGSMVEHIDCDEDLLGSGIVDSFGLAQLIVFLQERYGITVAEAELTPEQFRSLRSIEAFVHERERSRTC